MRTLEQRRSQQIELQLPVYLIEQIDEFAEEYNLNRTDIVTNSVKSYIAEQEAQEFYKSFDKSCKELKEVLDDPKKARKLETLDEFLDGLEQ